MILLKERQLIAAKFQCTDIKEWVSSEQIYQDSKRVATTFDVASVTKEPYDGK